MKSHPVFAGILVAGCLVAAPASSASAGAVSKADGPTYLFVINSRSGRISGVGKDTGNERLTVKFRGVSDHATQFADRPVRKAYVLSTIDLVHRWRGWFHGNPPNAVLSFVYPGHRRGQPHSIVLQLKRPRYDAKSATLTFRAHHLHRQADLSPLAKKHIKLPHRRPPAQFMHGSLFIDSVTDGPTTPCTPEPEVSCPNANLGGVDWSGRDLSYAELNGANLRGANLSGATFRFADMSDVDLSGANLTNANFADAHMRRATVTDATLQGTDFSRSTLIGGLFPGADMSAAKQVSVKGTVLNRALLAGARFVSNDLSTTQLKAANLSGADFTDANLSTTLLDSADLSAATLDRADISQARFFKATLKQASLVSANASNANLSAADLSQAKLTGANMFYVTMTDANLSGADLRNVYAARANMARNNLSGADMSNMDLRYASITGSDMRQTSWFTAVMPHYQMLFLNLSGTDFTKFYPPDSYYILNFNGSDLSNTNWRGWDRRVLAVADVDFTDADLRDMKPPPYSFFNGSKFTRTKLSGSTFNAAWFTNATFRNADARNVHWESGYLAGTRFIDTDLTGSWWTNKSPAVGEDGTSYAPIFWGNTICPEGGPIPCTSLMP